MTATTADTAALLRQAINRGGEPSSDYDLNPPAGLPAARKLRSAAVLLGVVAGRGGPEVVLTKRSSRLRHHPGQIAFPGGKCDPGDPTHEAAALREAEEEIGLPPGHVRVLGRLPSHETVTGFDVVPVVGWIDRDFTPRPEAGEVDEVFRVPLAHVIDAASFRVESRLWRGKQRRYFTVPYGPYYIWGATARILRGLADRMDP